MSAVLDRLYASAVDEGALSGFLEGLADWLGVSHVQIVRRHAREPLSVGVGEWPAGRLGDRETAGLGLTGRWPAFTWTFAGPSGAAFTLACDCRMDRQALVRDKLELVRPHLARAACMSGEIAAAERSSEMLINVLDSICYGVAVVDPEGALVLWNQEARRLIRSADALAISSGVLRLKEPQDSDRWLEVVQRVAQGLGDDSVMFGVRGGDGRQRLQLLLIPLLPVEPWSGPGARSRVLVILSDLDRVGLVRPDLVAGMFGLTPSEGRLAHALLLGKSLTEAAEFLGISINTAKTQLNGLFHKTGTRRQPELAQLFHLIPFPSHSEGIQGHDPNGKSSSVC